MATPQIDQVKAAAAAVVDAFAQTDTEAYFAAFDERASFVFHPEREILPSRAAYEALWKSWLDSGWRVVACDSRNGAVTPFEGGAVFTHEVHTITDSPEGREEYDERESIIFAFDGEHLLGIHEHLSPAPTEEKP
ncbi:nuclear transport factor 2 family protein [Actinomycetota bacterium]